MRILAFEHVTGGGMLDDPDISALAPEGEAMLRALVEDLLAIPGVEVAVLRDPRLPMDVPARMFVPATAADVWTVFREAAKTCDAVWPIAPESNGCLLRAAIAVQDSGSRLIGCDPETIRIASSKSATASALARHGIPVISCYASEDAVPPDVDAIVAKPDDGAGCLDTFLFRDRLVLREWLASAGSARLILQPHVQGQACSLSLICCEGRVRLLSCNLQRISIVGDTLSFHGVRTNAVADPGGRYAQLAQRIAAALPGLWGYCGVDFIETTHGPVVVEINPRLTTSYAGLRAAIGMNPAQLVLGLPGSLAEGDHA